MDRRYSLYQCSRLEEAAGAGLWLDGRDLVAAAVTTAEPRTPYDVPLADWSSSGLRRASTVRLSRLDCLEQSLLVARVGAISSADGGSVRQAWARYVRPQF
ncbi:MAG TPA: hypothetical protein PJ982_10020 [Lacipirellulaceae bacterium]|nr:hypothetical protein [Lacipirellulaceae bacterium]